MRTTVPTIHVNGSAGTTIQVDGVLERRCKWMRAAEVTIQGGGAARITIQVNGAARTKIQVGGGCRNDDSSGWELRERRYRWIGHRNDDTGRLVTGTTIQVDASARTPIQVDVSAGTTRQVDGDCGNDDVGILVAETTIQVDGGGKNSETGRLLEGRAI